MVNPAAVSLLNPTGPRGDGPLKQLLILTPGACAAARGRGVIPPAPGAYTPPPKLLANDTLPALVTPVPCPTPAAAAAAPAAPTACPGGAHCGVDATTCCCRCCWCMSEPADTAGDMPLPNPPPAPAAAAAAFDAGVFVVPQWPREALANRDPAGRAAAWTADELCRSREPGWGWCSCVALTPPALKAGVAAPWPLAAVPGC